MPKTYEPIQTQTVGTAVATVTFSSIPQTYTDLTLIINGGFTAAGTDMRIRFNSDSGTNYSRTGLYNSSTSAVSSYRTSSDDNFISPQFAGNNYETTGILHFMNYSNSSTYKSILLKTGFSTYIFLQSGLWRSTSAITGIECGNNGATTWRVGSTLTLFGVKAA